MLVRMRVGDAGERIGTGAGTPILRTVCEGWAPLVDKVRGSLIGLGCVDIGLDVDIVIDDDLPLAVAFCHDLQKTRAEAALCVEVKAGRRATLKSRNPSQGLADG